MRIVELALGWELWIRNRGAILVIAGVAGLAGAVSWTRPITGIGGGLAEAAGYGALVTVLFITFGCFHFTEGRRRGGFGTFPTRLFQLPVTTTRLVAMPMLSGAVAVVVVYLGVSALLFAPLGLLPPRLWPCLYLVASLTWFQAIIWAFPGSRYRRLFLLSLAASVIGFAWMFFMPHMIEGTLSDWGYTGSVADFQRRWQIVLMAAGPVAFGVSLALVRRQRHGPRGTRVFGWRTGPLRTPARRTAAKPYASPAAAMFALEWGQTGWLLPGSVGLILLFTGIPICLSGSLGTGATWAMLIWFGVAPFLLAAVLATGFCKADFWQEGLELPPFQAVRPVPAGAWVMAKLKVAALSVLVTWGMVLPAGLVCVSRVGDARLLDELWRELGHAHSPGRIAAIFGLGTCLAALLTWRLYVQYLWVGLSGRTHWHRLVCGATALVLVGLFIGFLSQDGGQGDGFGRHLALVLVMSLPWLVGGAVIVKAVAAVWAWQRVESERMMSPGEIRRYLLGWLAVTVIALGWPFAAFPHTVWLRDLVVLVILWLVPLAGPALATLALAANRRSTT